jgi:hypothetical protein
MNNTAHTTTNHAASRGAIAAPTFKIEDDAVWIADLWHGDTGEVIGWHKLGDVAYCVTGDCHSIATHAVALYGSAGDVLIQDAACCKKCAARIVFGHRDDQYAISRELTCPGLMEEIA